ncbi:MAG: hypothetical protein ACD_4C00480G0007 [uncultured bacterium (gcode 4)]|uniref:Uncharacterized protein n=1 Tax=uncultured bacterium (gcode 4) TaxID=1234023 RepID=K2G7E3_9BACT|nr:MAG: hypothetical protein ACD_4C00480G0007 [uncultured bacterium (gcode 4)]
MKKIVAIIVIIWIIFSLFVSLFAVLSSWNGSVVYNNMINLI